VFSNASRTLAQGEKTVARPAVPFYNEHDFALEEQRAVFGCIISLELVLIGLHGPFHHS